MFQNKWLNDSSFMDVIEANCFVLLHHKDHMKWMETLYSNFKILKQFLKWWNNHCIYNIFIFWLQ